MANQQTSQKESQKTFQKGDKVQWSSGRGTATGTVQEMITKGKTVGGKTISASEDNPRYLVKTDSSDKVTSRSPDALSMADSTDSKGESRDNAQPSSKRSSKAPKSAEGSSSSQSASKKGRSREDSSKKAGSKKGGSTKAGSTKSSTKNSSKGSAAGAVEVGDRVEWKTRQGKTTGIVKEKLTETTQIKGHTAKATENDPQYLVESDRTGSEAAHKPESLKPAE